MFTKNIQYDKMIKMDFERKIIMRVNVNIKVEESVKNQSEKIFSEMGLDMTTAVNLFLLATIREKKIPFEITTIVEEIEEQKYEGFLIKKLRNAEEQEKLGMMRKFDNFKDEIDKNFEKKFK